MVIPELTDLLFRERPNVTLSPRSQSGPSPAESSIYHFFDSRLPMRNEIGHLMNRGMHEGEATLIDKTNRHNKVLSALGILPNQLRTLLKNTIGDKTEEALTDFRRSLFFSGYRVWKRRKVLVASFWNTTAPDEWKKQDLKRAPKRRKKKYDTRCNNPFHYLKKHSNFSQQKETRCPCSVAERAQRSLNLEIFAVS